MHPLDSIIPNLMTYQKPSNKDADELILYTRVFKNKLYVFTDTSTYRVRIRKRWRDTKKAASFEAAILRKVASLESQV